jgi:hypothetical protein
MNNFLLKFKSISKSINNFFKINPHKHWMFLLYIFFVLIGVLILSSLFLLYQIKNDRIFQVKLDQIGNKTLLKEDILKTVRDDSTYKSKTAETIINTPFPYKDPSF